MPHFRSIRNRRARKRLDGRNMELNLTSMMDILVIILVFLLKSQASNTSVFIGAEGAEMPYSRTPDVPPDSLHVAVTREYLAFQDQKLLYFNSPTGAPPAPAPKAPPGTKSHEPEEPLKLEIRKEDLDDGGRRITPLYDALVQAREKSELLRAKSGARTDQGEPLPFDGILAIQADKRVPYDMLRRVMYTAAVAGYKTYRLLAMKKEE
ncbi:MAG TPA: biopolymer transporter ExbD [Bdellovibrionota bacterium]|jgi:biopolymer transport protein ExbD|nr:biopolymer transporter ExbD [Bdellovibrionota bacterium]